MAAPKFTAVSFRPVYPAADVPPHEVLLAFNVAPDAAAFRSWWAEQGAEVFAVWLRSRRPPEKAAPSLLAEFARNEPSQPKEGT